MHREQWMESVYCFRCGARLLKGSDPVDRVTIPSRSVGAARAVAGTIANRPAMAAVTAVGVGALCLAVSPFLILAGHWLAGLGAVVVLLSWLVDSMDGMTPARNGAKHGALMVGAGVLVTGAGYVVMAVGGVSAIGGVGLGAYTGVKAYVGYRRMKQLTVNEPAMLEGGHDGSGNNG